VIEQVYNGFPAVFQLHCTYIYLCINILKIKRMTVHGSAFTGSSIIGFGIAISWFYISFPRQA